MNENQNSYNNNGYTAYGAGPISGYTGYNGYYAPSAPEPPRPPKKKKSGTAIKIIAIVLACIIVGGIAGIGAFAIAKDMQNSAPALAAVTQTPETKIENPSAPTPTAAPVQTPVPATPAPVGEPLPVNTLTTGEDLTAPEVYEKVVQACVGVVTPITTTNYFGLVVSTPVSGSGFIITEDGYILTNYHVVEDANEGDYPLKVVTYSGDEYSATIVGYDEENDVALLKIDADGLHTVTIGSIEGTKVGEKVYAIGNPLGELTYTFTDGIISALDREMATESGISINMFQTNVAINSGNSGGPIINSQGEVIGIASAKYMSSGIEGLGFGIPIDDAMKIANDIVTYGFVRGKPYFGITVTTANTSGYSYGFGFGYGSGQSTSTVAGAQIVAVDDNSCAHAADLKVGDIITKLDDAEIRNQSDLIIAKAAYSAGDTVRLTVYRDGEYLELTLVFDELGAKEYASRTVEG